MKKLRKVLLSSLSLLSLISCSSNIIDVIKSPAEDGGLEGNAASDTVTKADSKALKTLLEKASKIKKYTYEIKSNVIGYESHSIMHYTPNAWFDERLDSSTSFGMAQTYGKKEVFKYYLNEEQNEVIPSIYEYAGLTGEMDKLVDLYSALSTAHINMLQDTFDTFEAMYVSTNKFLITDSESASVFQYMTTYGTSITSYINGIYVEILDEENIMFKVTTDLGDAGNIECIFVDKTKVGTKIDFVNELIEKNQLKGVDYHDDMHDLFTNKLASNNYVLEGTKLVGDSTMHRYNIHCTDDYFFLDYTEPYKKQGYKGFGYVMVEKGKEVTYKYTNSDNQVVTKTQTLAYDACYSFKEDGNGSYYIDKFVGPIESDGLKFVEVNSLSEVTSPKLNTYYIVYEDGAKRVYEYKEISDGKYGLTYVMDWFNSVADFPINDISASFYFSSNGLCDLAPMFYEQDLKNPSLYHSQDKDIMGLIANGLFGWGFMATNTWMSYVTESRVEVEKVEEEIVGAKIALGILASVNGGDYKEQVVYYDIKDFGKGNVESVDNFLYPYLGGE